MKANAVLLDDPMAASHGGTLRSRAMHEAMEAAGLTVHPHWPTRWYVADTPAPATWADRAKVSAGRWKRQLLPMPTRMLSGYRGVLERLGDTEGTLTLVSAMSLSPVLSRVDGCTWMDFMDLWSDFALRESTTRRGVARVTSSLQSRYLRWQEARLVHRADIVTVAGWKDCEELRRRGAPAHWLPSPIPDAAFTEAPAHRPPVAGLFGNFRYWPNVDALHLLLDDWLGPLRQAGWTVLVAGLASDSLGISREGVEVLGPVRSSDEVYERISLALAPIRLGGGIKVKVVEALSRGVPVLGTPEAFEGLDPTLRQAEFLHLFDDGIPQPSAVGTVDPRDPRLDPYRHSSFAAQVRGLVDQLAEEHP